MVTTSSQLLRRSQDTLLSFRWTLFARMLAVAVLFHLAGNSRDALAESLPLALVSVLLGASAALVLVAPRARGAFAVLCLLVPVSVWYEAPLVGNHWVLAAALAATGLLAVLTAARTEAGEGLGLWVAFAGPARLALLAAYASAAFAKLNTGFLNPETSCAVFYHNQLALSWNLEALALTDGSVVAQLVPVAAAVTEVSVVALLAVPSTRRVGLVVAVSFHWLLAMDLAQHFWDFSAVLFAGFLLFLDDDQTRGLRLAAAQVGARLAPAARPARVVVVAAATATTALAVMPVSGAADVVLVLLGHLVWWCYGTVVLVVVLVLLWAPRVSGPGTALFRAPRAALLVVPALVLLNGLTPYLEMKTGWSWTMYSNLRTVAGESNHLLLPGTLDLTGTQQDLVRVLDSSDPALRELGRDGYAVVYSEFREYAHAHPEVSVRYERGGQVVDVARLGDTPVGRGGVSVVSERLQSFRVVDLSGSERCLTTYGPAR